MNTRNKMLEFCKYEYQNFWYKRNCLILQNVIHHVNKFAIFPSITVIEQNDVYALKVFKPHRHT